MKLIKLWCTSEFIFFIEYNRPEASILNPYIKLNSPIIFRNFRDSLITTTSNASNIVKGKIK